MDHVKNFLDCVKSRKLPNGDVLIGHRSAQASHLGNISYMQKRRIDFDPSAKKSCRSRSSERRPPGLRSRTRLQFPQAERLVVEGAVRLQAVLYQRAHRRRKIERRQLEIERPPVAIFDVAILLVHAGMKWSAASVRRSHGSAQRPMYVGEAQVNQAIAAQHQVARVGNGSAGQVQAQEGTVRAARSVDDGLLHQRAPRCRRRCSRTPGPPCSARRNHRTGYRARNGRRIPSAALGSLRVGWRSLPWWIRCRKPTLRSPTDSAVDVLETLSQVQRRKRFTVLAEVALRYDFGTIFGCH